MKDPHSSAETQYPTPAHISDEPPSDQQNNAPPAPVVDSASENVVSSKSRKVTRDDIELVQNLIERCLQLYMNREEAVNILLNQARIEPGITNLIWQKLEEENADFFKAYYIRLKLKRQITMFNKLLEQQYHLMESHAAPKVPLTPMQNGIPLVPGYHMLQQPLMSSAGHPQINSVGGTSNCHMTNGMPAPGNFHPMAVNMGKDMVMDAATATTNLTIPKSEIASEPSFVASCGQYPFQSTAISDMSADASAIEARFLSNNPLEGLQGGPYNGIGNSQFPRNLSISDIAASEFADFTVEQFLADCPSQSLQPEED